MENKKSILTGSVIASAIIGLASINAYASVLSNFSTLGSGAEVRTNLLSKSASDVKTFDLKCGDSTKTKDSKGKDGKCGDDKKKMEKDGKGKDGKCGEGKCGDGKKKKKI